MPGQDKTGPYGEGSYTGRRGGNIPPRKGQKFSGGQGRGRSAGPTGKCVCPVCGAIAQHEAGTPCNQVQCPKCGAVMIRE